MTSKKRVGVLISGRGSNLLSLIEACKRPEFPAEIVLVVSNRADAGGLQHGTRNNIPTQVIDHKQFATREEFEDELTAALEAEHVDLVCNAGFMRLLTENFVDHWLNRQLKIHPSLLPSYKGLNTHARVLADGSLITGCSVHFVRTEMDSGPLIAQAAIGVVPGETEESLAARVLAVEHVIYPYALHLVASGAVVVENDRVKYGDKLPDLEQPENGSDWFIVPRA